MTRPFEKAPENLLRAEIARLEGEVEAMRKTTLHRFRDEAHEVVDLSVAAARERVQHILADWVRLSSRSVGAPLGAPAGLADAWALATDPAIAGALHAAIDAAPRTGPTAVFADVTRAEYDQRRDELMEAIEAREVELTLRDAERAAEAANARLVALSGRGAEQ